MRKTLLMSVALFGLAAPAFAQSGATQTPPSPNASSQMPQQRNSAPVGATVAAPQANPSGPIGTTVTGAPPMTESRKPMKRVYRARTAPMSAAMTAPMDSAPGDQAAPPTSAYRGGVGSPLSTRATDLAPSRGEKMGSRLPDPGAAANTPRELLVAAQRALNQGKTGAAQQALEMAETRVLSRTTDPSMANQPDPAAMAQNIAAARRALGSRDPSAAKMAIAAALEDRMPPRGPATMPMSQPGMMPMGQPGMAPMGQPGMAPMAMPPGRM